MNRIHARLKIGTMVTLLAACSSGGVPAELAHRPKAAVQYILREWQFVESDVGWQFCNRDNGETANDVLIGVRRDVLLHTGFLCGKPMQLGQPISIRESVGIPDADLGEYRSCAREWDGVLIGMIDPDWTHLGGYTCGRMFDRWGARMTVVDNVHEYRTRDPRHVFQCPSGTLVGHGTRFLKDPVYPIEWIYTCGEVF